MEEDFDLGGLIKGVGDTLGSAVTGAGNIAAGVMSGDTHKIVSGTLGAVRDVTGGALKIVDSAFADSGSSAAPPAPPAVVVQPVPAPVPVPA